MAFTLILRLNTLFACCACATRCVTPPAFGIVDFFHLTDLFGTDLPELYSLIDVRLLRLLRIFRILGLSAYSHEYYSLIYAIRASARKITIFISFVLIVAVIMGTVMYLVESPHNDKYPNIPTAIYGRSRP